jgi:hypothetical protein
MVVMAVMMAAVMVAVVMVAVVMVMVEGGDGGGDGGVWGQYCAGGRGMGAGLDWLLARVSRCPVSLACVVWPLAFIPPSGGPTPNPRFFRTEILFYFANRK